ncbi:MAG: polymer-forming cytoskeletal protein [Halieaceae bacterium]|jgi:cytoskeletal protein CcmA (bactofilin family)|nr:polymer-forming cytoskeletal protein [Halieaceae bacterium]
MWGDKEKSFSAPGGTTLVSRDTVIVGDIHFTGALEIEGLVQGNIIAQPGTDAFVRVVHKGRVEGEIRAPSVVMNGEIVGDIYSTKHLELASKARVQGSVFYAQVEMAAGAEVNGGLQHNTESSTAEGKAPESPLIFAGAAKNDAEEEVAAAGSGKS